MPHRPSAGRAAPRLLAAALLLASCAATSNPSRERLKPIAASPPRAESEAAPDADADAAPGSGGEEEILLAAGPAPAGDGASAQRGAGSRERGAGSAAEAAQPGATGAAGPGGTVVARVAGGDVLARELLERLWLRAPDGVRQELEQLVESRFVLAEAVRLGLELRPEDVEEEIARTYEALQEEMRERDVSLPVGEYVRRALGVDPAFYDRQVRRQSITHLLAQRAIRAWTMQNERAEVEVLEVRERADADLVRSELDAGREFEDVAAELAPEPGDGPDDGREPRAERTRLQVVRSARSALARLAFATRTGQVGGPLEEGDVFLFVSVEQRHAPLEGTWAELGDRVLASLVRTPVRNPEYWQWKIAMQARYRVEREPFLDLVGAEQP